MQDLLAAYRALRPMEAMAMKFARSWIGDGHRRILHFELEVESYRFKTYVAP